MFVGIEQQHPVVAGQVDGALLLRAVALEAACTDDVRAMARAISRVASVEPESSTTSSSQNARLARHASSVAALLNVVTTPDNGARTPARVMR